MTSSQPTLPDLIARLEKAEGPSRELDGLIADAMGIAVDSEVGAFLPHFTRSVDHALWLVPAKHHVHMHFDLMDRDAKHLAGVCPLGENCGDYYSGATPALALCIAALKARQQESERR